MQPEVARILDANFNRAREGLRVAEEFARFIAEDRRLAEQAKIFRHTLAAAARRLESAGKNLLLECRDTAGDVGTALKTDSEFSRPSADAVAAAAAKRVGEALRVLCEYTKLVEPTVAAELENLRYRFYDWEKWLVTASDRRRIRVARVYLLLSENLCPDGDWQAAARAAIDAGVDVVQLREKRLADTELLARAQWLVEQCKANGVLSIINDRPDIARLVNSDGVHIGRDDLPVWAARKIVRPTQLIGTSTHSAGELTDAITAGADYVALGPMFASTTKPEYGVAGLAYAQLGLGRLAKAGIPHVAIGGITQANVAELAAIGIRCVAMSSGLLSAADLAAAVRAVKSALA